MTASEFKDLYNTQFFNGQQLRPVRVGITLKLDDRVIQIPAVMVTASTRIHDIAKGWYQMLQIADEVEAKEAVEAAAAEPELLRFEVVQVGKSTYLVEERADDTFHIQRQDTAKLIGSSTPHGRKIVKAYRKQIAVQEEE